MAFQRLGRRLEDGIAAYNTATKANMLSGVDIITPKRAGAANAPWLAIYSGSSVPWSDGDRRGEIRGPMRTTLRVTIAEHMKGTAIDQYCGEFVDIISQSLRIGTIVNNTTASAVFRLTYLLLDDPAPQPGDLLRINGNEYTIASVAIVPLPAISQYDITLTTTATFTAGTPVFMETADRRQTADFADLIDYLNDLGTISVWRIAFVSESANVSGDLRTQDFEFEIDGVNSPNLT